MIFVPRTLLILSALSAGVASASTGYHCEFMRTNAQGHDAQRAVGDFTFHGKSYLSLNVTRTAAILELSPDTRTFSVSIGSTVSSRDRQFSTAIPAPTSDRLPEALNYSVEAFTETAVTAAQPFQLNLNCKKF